mmetsp:Transcript_28077/g.89636  ORF Transcript_28077/g.89636 Transcript_28077/m.89636 type:complete len:97 (+) Transcript_28077:197-487(+)
MRLCRAVLPLLAPRLARQLPALARPLVPPAFAAARRSMSAAGSGGGIAVEAARAALRAADAVCFDVDSTVIQEEGIDVLAAHCGAAEEVPSPSPSP